MRWSEQIRAVHVLRAHGFPPGAALSLILLFRRRAPRLGFLGRPPSFPLARAAFAFAAVETLPMSAPTLISFLQCGQFT